MTATTIFILLWVHIVSGVGEEHFYVGAYGSKASCEIMRKALANKASTTHPHSIGEYRCFDEQLIK